MKRQIFAICLCLASSGLCAENDFVLGPRSLSVNPAMDDLLGFAMSAAPGPNGSKIAVAGAVGRFATIATMAPGGDRFVPGQILSSGVSDDNFGFAVAIGGPEGEVIAVGAPGDDSFFNNSGRVYVYRRAMPGQTHQLVTSVIPPLPANVGNFGAAVAISPDGAQLVVGESRAQQAAVEVGAVHIYDISGMIIPAPQTLIGTLGTGSRFGQSVAHDGTRIVLGAPLADDPSMLVDTGALVVLANSGGSFSPDGATLFADDRQGNDRLGLSVAIDGNVLIGGAGNDDKPAGGDAGSAYVFRRAASWTQEQKLRSSAAQVQERFGQSVAIAGDEALVGAYCLTVSGCVGNGAVYAFGRVGGVWNSKLRYSPGDGASFGHAIAYAGADTLAVGAFGTDASFTDQGAIYALNRVDVLLADGFEDP